MKKSSIFLILVLIVILVIGVGVGTYVVVRNSQENNTNNSDTENILSEDDGENEEQTLGEVLQDNPVYFSNDGATYKLSSIDTEPTKVADVEGIVSPDEKLLAFEKNKNIAVIDLSSKNEFVSTIRVSELHSWSPNNQYLLDVEPLDRFFKFTIYEFDAQSENFVLNRELYSSVNYLNWINNQEIIFSKEENQVNSTKSKIIKLNIRTGDEEQLFTPSEEQFIVQDIFYDSESKKLNLDIRINDLLKSYIINDQSQVSELSQKTVHKSIRDCIYNLEGYTLPVYGGNNLKILNSKYFVSNLETGLTVFSRKNYIALFNINDCTAPIILLVGNLAN